jgi:hypothetical protein
VFRQLKERLKDQVKTVLVSKGNEYNESKECRRHIGRLLPTSEAAPLLNVSESGFRALANNRALVPDFERRTGFGGKRFLWRLKTVALLGGISVAEVRLRIAERKKLLAAQEQQRRDEAIRRAEGELRERSTLLSQFATFELAVLAAAEAMYRLNHYAKHWSQWRDKVYSVKNKLIRSLYAAGYCFDSRIHSPTDEAILDCAGDRDWITRVRGCHYAFRFRICEKVFSWHQPMRDTSWPVELTEDKITTWPASMPKAFSLSPQEFNEAISLVLAVASKLDERQGASKDSQPEPS